MKNVLLVSAILEGLTGLALLLFPSLVGPLLLGEQIVGPAIMVARVAGIALIALGISCSPGSPRVGMLAYSVLVTLYLAYLGFTGAATGLFLWPAVVVHAVLAALLVMSKAESSVDVSHINTSSRKSP